MHACTHACMHACMYVCVYIYIYIYTHTCIHKYILHISVGPSMPAMESCIMRPFESIGQPCARATWRGGTGCCAPSARAHVTCAIGHRLQRIERQGTHTERIGPVFASGRLGRERRRPEPGAGHGQVTQQGTGLLRASTRSGSRFEGVEFLCPPGTSQKF